MRSSSSKVILFLSDIHIGSIYAPCSPKPYIAKTDTYWNPSKLQKKLYSYWLWVKDQLTQAPYIVCVNGEPIDGDNYKETGGSTWTTDINDQLKEAAKLLQTYRPKHLLMTRGSGYHVRKNNTEFEDTLCELMKLERYSIYNRDYTKSQLWDSHHAHNVIDDILNFSVNDKVFNVTHHIGYNRAYHNKSQALTAELANMEFMRGKYWKSKDFPSVIVRGHVHYFVEVRFARIRGFTCPTFKISADKFMTRKGLPDPASLGAIEVIVESNGKILVEPHIVANTDYPKHEILRL